MYDIIGKRKWFYLISLAFTIPGLIFILLTFLPGSKMGLQFSIAYTGGTIWEVHFQDSNPTPDEVLAVLNAQGLEGEVNRTTQDGRDYTLIRTEPLLRETEGVSNGAANASPGASVAPGASPAAAAGSPAASVAAAPVIPSAAPTAASSAAPAAVVASPAASAAPSPAPSASPVAAAGPTLPSQGKFGELASAMVAAFGPIDEVRQQTSVGPVVSSELIQQTFVLILMGALGIMAWITFRFKDFRMGVTALGALLHDVIVVVGIFAIMGTFLALQVDALFVTAMLTVIGFSVHDTIVVFDRIRENRVRHAGEPFDQIVNHSILQTIGRSLNTSLTVILTLTALFLLGGEAIHAFVLALLIGIISGTYSSIFNASPLLVDWHLWDERRKAKQVTTKTPARAASRT
ncbi:MAG: protein translocase subunit SecF [Chloroflexota bacterium]